MAVKFSQFNSGTQLSDIDYIVGYKSTDNVQIPIGLVTANTTYTVATAQSGSNETLKTSEYFSKCRVVFIRFML